MSDTVPTDPGHLRRLLAQHFSDNDLRSLCQDLRVDYDILPGEGTEAKARELIAFMQKRGRLAELLAAAARERPHVAWGVAAPATHPLGPVSDRAGSRVVIRGNTLLGQANRITVSQTEVNIEENLLAGQAHSIDVESDKAGAKQS